MVIPLPVYTLITNTVVIVAAIKVVPSSDILTTIQWPITSFMTHISKGREEARRAVMEAKKAGRADLWNGAIPGVMGSSGKVKKAQKTMGSQARVNAFNGPKKNKKHQVDIVNTRVILIIRTFHEVIIQIGNSDTQNTPIYESFFQYGDTTPHLISNRHKFFDEDYTDTHIGGLSTRTIFQLSYAYITITFTRDINLKQISAMKVDRTSFINVYNVRSFYEKAGFKRAKGSKESALAKKRAKGMGKKTPVVVVSEEEEDIDSITNNANEPEPDLNNNTDDTFAEYERAALNSHCKKEHFRRKLRDIPIATAFSEKDIIAISNKIIREEEEAQGKALKAVEAIEENNLFVLGDDTDIDNENRAPPSIQAKGSFITHKDNEKAIPDQ
ncbi:hypothetical protein NA56DRAFT_697253 [Hyaloscypha hepaticicola]|uniref:Uncharacterized protein n=1 Tax=Hyaloscypha hepaticicola TaxID=2082293 RepID=A0A2J6QLF7_9HELO|nr:hypothetical protein NA56DRAFT_697253 [Hyaloscypha hepaticicola]